jgi:OmpA-OmpF porin, OOP family
LVKAKKKSRKWNLESYESAAYYYIDDIRLEKVVNRVITSKEIATVSDIETKDTFDLKQIKIDSSIVLENIIFEFDKSELLPESFNELNKLFNLMQSNPGIKIKLEGHTDNIGSYEYNLKLSLMRVQAVTQYLINKGIPPERIEFAGYSFLYPLVSNDTEEGRKINRRVAFKVIDKDYE